MPHNGVMLDFTDGETVFSLESNPGDLTSTLNHFTAAGKTACWAKLAPEAMHLVTRFTDQGFRFHHCEEQTLVMYKWLPVGQDDRVPAFATHIVGVAGCVVDDAARELLVVREKRAPVGAWKLPGGLQDLGEDFAATAIREVEEETGVKAEFRGLLGLRHAHGAAFGRSDLYVVTHLAPLTKTLDLCNHEIAEGKWMKVDDFIDASVHPMNNFIGRIVRERLDKGLTKSNIQEATQISPYTKKDFMFYYAETEEIPNQHTHQQ
eukprot:Clim_evm6s24 gene=Clim_evmTU6s24